MVALCKMRRALVFVPLVAVFLFWASTPPPLETYAKSQDGKIVIDKDLLDSVRMSPLVGFLMWVARPFAKYFLHLDPFALVEAAKREVGLDQFYNESYWFPRLSVLCADVNKNDGLSALGRFMIRDNIKRGLTTQLRVMELVRVHPEILQEVIEKPIVVLGPPRTMTTLCQTLLGLHPQTHYLRFIETHEPLDPPSMAPGDFGTMGDPRVRLMSWARWVLEQIRPLFPFMFPVGPLTAAEDVELMTFAFGSPVFEVQGYFPEYTRIWHTQDNTPAYEFLKLLHQTLQWQHKQRMIKQNLLPTQNPRWILKTPEHAFFLKEMTRVYPDALYVLTVRNPVEIIQSYIPLVVYVSGLWNDRIDARQSAMANLNWSVVRWNHLVDHIGLIPRDRLLTVPFRSFVQNASGWALDILAAAGLDQTLAEEAIARYLKEHPREGSNRLLYRIQTLGSEFEEEAIAQTFARYIDQFREWI